MEDLLQAIKENFGDLGLKEVKKVDRGVLSDNYIAVGEKKYFVHGHRQESLNEIQRITEVESFFSAQGIPVILPLTTNSGEVVWQCNGRFFSLMPFIESRQYHRENIPDTAVDAMGEMLGRIHRAGSSNFPQIDKRRTLAWSDERFEYKAQEILSLIDKKDSRDEFDLLVIKKISLQRELIKENTLSFEDLELPFDHLIHGDFHEYNVFFTYKDEVEYVFDWEKTAISPRLYEVARSIDLICIHAQYENKNFEKAQVFLRSYSKSYPYDKSELKKALQIYYLKNLYILWMEESHYYKGNTRPDIFMPGTVRHLEYFSKNGPALIDLFLD